MAISFSRYVDITSAVGGVSSVSLRDLILRIFSTSLLIPPGSYAEFSTSDAVKAYFGSASEEYKRAAKYFGFVSKVATAPQKISFASYTPVAVAPRIYGSASGNTDLLSTWKAVTNGSMTITIGGVALTITALSFADATSLSDVAADVQTAIHAGTGAEFTAAAVAWNASRGSFDFVGGATGVASLTITAGATGTDIAAMLGWLQTDAIVSPGADAQSVSDALAASANASNNFGMFGFTTASALTLAQYREGATWNAATSPNIMFAMVVPVTGANASAWAAALDSTAGTILVLDPQVAGEYPEQFPAQVLASTRYSKRGSTCNYMFYQGDLTPSVTDDTLADQYDALKINYYGQTQQAGKLISFFQRGYMCGGSTNPSDINVYCNEMWFKDAMGTAFMNLLLALQKLSANNNGKISATTTAQGVIDTAQLNGTISIGKDLTTAQKTYIADITGSDVAYLQIITAGYWLSVSVESYIGAANTTEYKLTYTLLYAKDDAVRKVEGSHILI